MSVRSASTAVALEPASARHARHFAAEALISWGMAGAVDAVALLVSELVTNSFLHARSGASVSLSASGEVIRVEVCDSSPQLPRRRDYGPASSTGRGLVLLESLSSSWGVERSEHGKCVWFTVGASDSRGRRDEVGLSRPAPFDLDSIEAL